MFSDILGNDVYIFMLINVHEYVLFVSPTKTVSLLSHPFCTINFPSFSIWPNDKKNTLQRRICQVYFRIEPKNISKSISKTNVEQDFVSETKFQNPKTPKCVSWAVLLTGNPYRCNNEVMGLFQ